MSNCLYVGECPCVSFHVEGEDPVYESNCGSGGKGYAQSARYDRLKRRLASDSQQVSLFVSHDGDDSCWDGGN